jgi:hypothetical protein
MSHLTYTTLLGYIGNELPLADRTKIEDHLFSDVCQECGHKLARLQKVLKVVTQDNSVAPPPAVLDRAFDLYQKRPISVRRPLSQVLATLQFDSRLQFSSLAARGPIRTRQMLFTAEDVDIDLQMTPESEDHNLTGQILGSEQANQPPQAFVSLKNEMGELLQGTQTDALGQFIFRQVPAGVYHLVFDMDSQEVTITRLELVND